MTRQNFHLGAGGQTSDRPFVDNQELVGFTTELKTNDRFGRRIAIYPNSGLVQSPQVPNPKSKARRKVVGLADGERRTTGDKKTQTVNLKMEKLQSRKQSIERRQNQQSPSRFWRLPLPDTEQTNIFVIKRGKTQHLKIPITTGEESGNWYKKTAPDSCRWFALTTAKYILKEVAVKGYIRKIHSGKFGDIDHLAMSAQ